MKSLGANGEEVTDPREEMLVRKRKECEELREMLLEIHKKAELEKRGREQAEEDAKGLRNQIRALESNCAGQYRGKDEVRSNLQSQKVEWQRHIEPDNESAISAALEEI